MSKMDPTAAGDYVAEKMREFYEANREGWWERFWRRSDRADNLMLGLMKVADKARSEVEAATTHNTGGE